MFQFSSFLVSCYSFTFLESSLGSQSVNFRLSILSFFLEISKSLNFFFLFILDSFKFSLLFFFSQSFGSVVVNYLLFKIFFLFLSAIFDSNCSFISFFNFLHKKYCSLFLFLLLSNFFFFKLLNLFKHLEHLFLSKFLFFNSLHLSFFYLINNN
jgi:hypothetical protein